MVLGTALRLQHVAYATRVAVTSVISVVVDRSAVQSVLSESVQLLCYSPDPETRDSSRDSRGRESCLSHLLVVLRTCGVLAALCLLLE